VIESEEKFGPSGAERMWDEDCDSRDIVTGGREEADRPSLGMAEQEIEGSLGAEGACGESNRRLAGCLGEWNM
jgi:hypothetical protein